MISLIIVLFVNTIIIIIILGQSYNEHDINVRVSLSFKDTCHCCLCVSLFMLKTARAQRLQCGLLDDRWLT